jgi:hypothetical protein
MEKSSTAQTLRLVAGRLDASGLPWCVMAGAAATCYGVTRPITDLDILICADAGQRILALFPEGQPKSIAYPGDHALDLGPVELWWGTLHLNGDGRFYPFAPDDQLIKRITRQPIAGMVVPIMPVEDILIFKAILQRGPQRGKHDLEDIQAIAQTPGNRLDLDYMNERAVACAALERVAPCLRRFGITLSPLP